MFWVSGEEKPLHKCAVVDTFSVSYSTSGAPPLATMDIWAGTMAPPRDTFHIVDVIDLRNNENNFGKKMLTKSVVHYKTKIEVKYPKEGGPFSRPQMSYMR